MPNNNLSDIPKDLINQTKFPFNHEKFNSYTSYSNYDFTNTIYLEEEKEEKYKSLPLILSDIFSFDKLDSFDNSIDGDDINSKENIYFIKNQKINKEKEKIFFIKKGKRKRENRKRGRLEKNTIPSYKLKHNKFSKDDIIQKIKRHFINRLLKYINEIYKGFKQKQNVKKKIKPLLISINPEKYNFYNNKKNIEFFNNTIENLFSAEISIRNCNFLRKHSNDSNKKRIAFLKKENKAKEVINILNSKVKEMYGKYINKELDEFCLDNDLIEVEKKDGTEYKNLYKKIAQELIYHFNKKQEKFENE
jgi:hypothetical protein